MENSLERSKRAALRFRPPEYRIWLKTEFDDAEAYIENISTRGCALVRVTHSLLLREKILLLLPMEGETVEIGAVIVRLDENTVGVKFTSISEAVRHRMFSYFAKLQREQS